jgi:hypothetical protein
MEKRAGDEEAAAGDSGRDSSPESADTSDAAISLAGEKLLLAGAAVEIPVAEGLQAGAELGRF